MRTIYVTSMRRGAGKTTVALALVRALRKRGVGAVGGKPIDTDALPGEDHDLLSRDARLLQRVSGPPDVPYTVVAPYRFSSGLSPAEAFEATGIELALAELAGQVRGLGEWGRVLVLEGARCAMTPLMGSHVELDLAAELGAELVGVLSPSPETLEEGLALAELAERRKLALPVVVLDHRGAEDSDPGLGERLARALRRRIVELPFVAGELEARVLEAEARLHAAQVLGGLADGVLPS